MLDCSYWGVCDTQYPFTSDIERFVTQVIISWEDGKSTCYYREAEKTEFAKRVIEKIKRDETYIDKICTELKNTADKFLKFAAEKRKGKITFDDYEQYQSLILAHYPVHSQVKIMVDYLPKDMLAKYLPEFQAARLHAEPVFTKSIEFSDAFAKQQVEKMGIPAKLIQIMTKVELHTYLEKGALPQRNELETRNTASAYLFFNGKMKIYTGKDFEAVKKIAIGNLQVSELKGTCAYPGKARGRARIVIDPNQAGDFQEGDILVTSMTRPEFLQLVKKSAAVVTDAGGILSHAAIVARELKKPCVIGTKNATKVLKDGDVVEVDAEKGIVRKLEK